MSINIEQSPTISKEPNREFLLLAADLVDEYPTLSSLVAGDSQGTRGDMVKRIAGLYSEVELLLETEEVYSSEASWLNFYRSKSPAASTVQKNGWLTVAVVGTKMSDEKIDYRRLFTHRSRWEVMLQHMIG